MMQVPERSALEKSQWHVVTTAGANWHITSNPSDLKAAEVRWGKEHGLRDSCGHGELTSFEHWRRMKAYVHIWKYIEYCSRKGGRWMEQWVVIECCHSLCLPINHFILWGRMNATPPGITQVLSKTSCEKIIYILLCFTSCVVMETSHPTPPTSYYHKRKREKKKGFGTMHGSSIHNVSANGM